MASPQHSFHCSVSLMGFTDSVNAVQETPACTSVLSPIPTMSLTMKKWPWIRKKET